MGCDQSTPVYHQQQGNNNNRTSTTANAGRTRQQHQPPTRTATKTNNKKYSTNASKKAEIRKRIETKKQTIEYQKKQSDLKKKKRKDIIAKVSKEQEQKTKTKYNFVPTQTALKKDISKYKRRSATHENDNSDETKIQTTVSVDENQFLKQVKELIPAEVRMISGCEDEQTSADVMNTGGTLPDPKGRAGGAATSALLELLYKHKDEKFSFQDALVALRDKLSEQGHTQIPQLTSSRPLDLDETPFTFHDTSSSGTRRALLVGINYVGQQGQLRGCHNDVYHMKDYLIKLHGFRESNITLLTDDGSGIQPTKKKMIDELIRLVDVSNSGDSVFFHYSGHGGFLEADQNSFKQKNDQYDQTLIPLDHRSAGQIRDFNLFNHFVRPMKAGVMVTCLMDCCHSGSVLDLPYSFKPTNKGSGSMYSQQANLADMAGIVFLGILAGAVIDTLLFDSIFDTLQYTLGVDDLSSYEGLYADMLYEDLVERVVEEEIERQIEEEVERQLEEEVEKELEYELQREIEKEIEDEIQREIEREIQREIEREAEREIQRELEREAEREIQRELEREMEQQMEDAIFDDMLGGGGDDFW